MYKVSLILKQQALGQERQDASLTLCTIELANKLFGDFREPIPKPKFENNNYVVQATGYTLYAPAESKSLEKFIREQVIFLPKCSVEGFYHNSKAEFGFYAGT